MDRVHDAKPMSAAMLIRLCDLRTTATRFMSEPMAILIGALAVEQCARLEALMPSHTVAERLSMALACVDMQLRVCGTQEWDMELIVAHGRLDSVVLIYLVVRQLGDPSGAWLTVDPLLRLARWARANEVDFRSNVALPSMRSIAWRDRMREIQVQACVRHVVGAHAFARPATLSLLLKLCKDPDSQTLRAAVAEYVDGHAEAPAAKRRHAACLQPLRRSARLLRVAADQ